jgi:hypothetical protein
VATANTIPDGEGGAINYATDTSRGGSLELLHATIAANDAGDGEGGAIDGGDVDDLVVSNSIVHGNAGSEQISGFEPSGEGSVTPLGEVETGTRTVSFSLLCDGSAPFAGEGNLCADPKLAGAAGGDVHQTAASPTLERASATLTGDLAEDYEGDARTLDYDKANGAQPDMGADEAPAPAVKPAPAAQQPAPAASGGVLGTQAKSCSSRRTFRIKLRNRGQKVVKATVIVNGKRVKVLRGKRLTSRVDLRGLPKGRFSVRITLKLANGKTISGVRRYYTCRPGRPSGPPEV